MDAPFKEPDRFIKQFLTALHNHQLTPGQKLPSESELAAECGMNKTNVHIAIKQLERLGYVRIVPRHASYVSETIDGLSLESLDALYYYLDELPTRHVLEAMLELREMLAVGVIRWMTRRPNEAHMEKLSTLLDRIEDTDTPEAYEAALNAFFICVYLESDNQMFPILMRSLRHSTLQVSHYITEYSEKDAVLSTFRTVLRFIAGGDSNQALRAWLAWNEPLCRNFLNNPPK